MKRLVNEKVVTEVEQVGEKVMYRVERQALRRLPKSNAIVFTIRTYQRPLKEVAKYLFYYLVFIYLLFIDYVPLHSFFFFLLTK